MEKKAIKDIGAKCPELHINDIKELHIKKKLLDLGDVCSLYWSFYFSACLKSYNKNI